MVPKLKERLQSRKEKERGLDRLRKNEIRRRVLVGAMTELLLTVVSRKTGLTVQRDRGRVSKKYKEVKKV